MIEIAISLLIDLYVHIILCEFRFLTTFYHQTTIVSDNLVSFSIASCDNHNNLLPYRPKFWRG